jgi:large subunit ribosomal protein L3
MSIGLIAQKCGMTRVFMPEEGISVPVTVLLVEPNRITQLKTKEKDGYTAVQVTKGQKKANRLSKPLAGHFKKANVEAGQGLWEFRVQPSELEKMTLGGEITVSLFETGQKVDVSGVTKGRGFTGVIRRHNFSSQRASHGNSLSHNAPGSIGQNQSPGRVFKGKKMAGHYGAANNTIQNLKVVQVDLEKNLLLVKGAIPGAPGGLVIVKPAIKQKTQKEGGK